MPPIQQRISIKSIPSKFYMKNYLDMQEKVHEEIEDWFQRWKPMEFNNIEKDSTKRRVQFLALICSND